ncbi:MAG: proline--tRNA ligase, partial [Oscillospiraceae bacterium]|nr:proline--tRNA ligase [Oscillospiraceae bacterium]
YAIEAMMHDGKALQAGTSHYFGDGFAKAFGIQFTSRDNKLEYPHQTSWGVTTRLIGAVIMTHGDNNGLVLPPAVAPVQAVIIPIQQFKEGVIEKANELADKLRALGVRVKVDDRDQSPGWKFAEHEMRGVPVRIEIGPKDIENDQCIAAVRYSGEKITVSLENALETFGNKILDLLGNEIPKGMYEKALQNRTNRTYQCKTVDEINTALNEKGDGFVEAMWCGDEACEDKVKELTGAGSRCIPFEQKNISDVCICCGKPAKHMVLWGKAY